MSPSHRRAASPAQDALLSAAEARDAAAAARDARAHRRDQVVGDSPARARRDRAASAEDRGAAAVDRQMSAADRAELAHDLATAHRDELTGLPLRDSGRELLEQVLARAARERTSVVLAFVDVDGLKTVNDSHGHAAGDAVLQAVGGSLRGQLRSYDTVIRWGGDEFVCALTRCGTEEAGRRFGRVARHLSGRGSISVGLVAVAPEEDLEHALGRADVAMYATRSSEPRGREAG